MEINTETTMPAKPTALTEASTDETVPKRKPNLFSEKRWLGRNLYVILAFLIPFLFVFVCLAIKGVSPFGSKQILVTDLWHQYYPFLVDFQDKLKTGGSLFWTWKSGGGTNYLALMSYYLASPLNFLSVFVPTSMLREFLYVITCIKIGCAGMFFALFLRLTFKRNDITITAFGIMYGLCAFIMGYYWNVIWLDTIALLPLVIAGTFALLRDGRFKLYIITLALSVLANYYIGLFTCAGVLLVCIGYSIVEFKGVKTLFVNFLKMVWCTAVALLITTILTLPAFYGLSHAHAADNHFPTTFAINIGASADFSGVMDAVGQTLANSASLTEPTAKEGLPNIYCGVLAIVLGILFLTCSKIKRRERVFCGLLLVFFILSFIIRQLDFIWHGFHFPNMLPHRFSFLYSFVLIYMAFRVYMNIDSVRLVHVIITAVGLLALLGIISQYDDTKNLIATALIGFIVIVWLMLYTLHIVPHRALAIALFIIAVAEGGCSAYIGVETVTVTDGSYYPLGTRHTYACVNTVDRLEMGNTDLERTEVTRYYTLNDNALIGIDGISMFNSMTNEAISKYMEKFGICGWNTSNRYTYQESSPFTNVMLNLKYLISPYGKHLDTIHNRLLYESSNVKLLENTDYIRQGFVVDDDILDFSMNTAVSNPIDNQNRIFRLATGIDGDLYEYLEVVSQGHTDYEAFPVNKNSFGNYSFSVKQSDSTPHLKYNYEAPEDGVAVAYFSASGTENVSLRVNDEEVISNYVKRPYIMTFGTVHKGDKLSLYADISDTSSGTVTVYCAMLNEALYRQGLAKFSQSVLDAQTVTDTEISGHIDVKESGVFYTSIPYVNGWRAYVDGQEVEIKPIGDAMLAFRISSGSHDITLRYMPEGFGSGVVLTAVGIGLFLITCLFTARRRKRRVASPAPEGSVMTKLSYDDDDTEFGDELTDIPEEGPFNPPDDEFDENAT